MATGEEQANVHVVVVYLHNFSNSRDCVKVEIHKRNTCEELIDLTLRQLGWINREESPPVSECPEVLENGRKLSNHSSTVGKCVNNAHNSTFELCEIMGTLDGQTCKERRLDNNEYPVKVQLLWPKSLPTSPNNETANLTEYRFVLREKRGKQALAGMDSQSSAIDTFLAKFLQQPKEKEYPDLCMLPELTEATLLENLKERFERGHFYTYIGPILVAVNPFKFFPIYNPKYVKLYQNRRLGDLPPHIFAIADATYHMMLKEKRNQCVVISGESGSGKTESTNFLLHHLTALSAKGTAATGIEQSLLNAGPVLEAFGNAVTAQNDNSSRFGKFIQVNYRENGIVCGANVQIYLLEKSRIISHAAEERNYHVFYYLLSGCSQADRESLYLLDRYNYRYLKDQDEGYYCGSVDDKYEFNRLRQSMELVGFGAEAQRKIFSVLSAVLLLGNIEYVKRPGYHSDDNAYISNPEVIDQLAILLQVKDDKLISALTTKRTVTKNETVVTRYKVSEAIWSRDAMAKCLYNALFDWIVLRINQVLLKKDSSTAEKGHYIGILDIFGFEDVGGKWNSFEQFCINYANERLQAYFNQHIFQFEQEEYQNQGICWTNIEYTDNTDCLQLLQGKPYGLFHLIDEECSIPRATDESMLEKLNKYHKANEYYEIPHKKEMAFVIAHYAGKVKYQVKGFREKNKDLMRADVVNALKNSKSAFVREMVGTDPVAVYRWAMVRASFRALFAFRENLFHHEASPETSQKSLNVERQLVRRSSESQLQALVRGDIDESAVPRFHPSASVQSNLHGLSHFVNRPANGIGGGNFVRSRKNRYEDRTLLATTTANNCLAANSNRYVSAIIEEFSSELSACSELMRDAGLLKKGPRKQSPQQKAVRGLQSIKALAGKRVSRRILSTVGAQFQSSLTRLMETLSQANPFFIRCIRSNNEKVPSFFNEDIILRQLRYTGMLETVRIRRAGYSVRLHFEDFVSQYRILLPKGMDSVKSDVESFIFDHPLLDRHNFQFGFSKMFMRDAEKLLLDDQLHRVILAHIQRLQSWVRTVLLRRRFLHMRESAIKIQAYVKGFLVRQRNRREYLAALCVQTYWRGYREEIRFLRLKKCVGALQCLCRGYLIRSRMKTEAGKRRDPSFLKFVYPSISMDMSDSLYSRIGSPRDESDEGVLTKGSNSQEDPFGSSPRDKGKTSLLYESEESSGILDDSDTERSGHHDSSKLHDRSWSLDVTFVLEDKKLKIVDEDEMDAVKLNRRPSLTPSSTSNKQHLSLRRAASTDNPPDNRSISPVITTVISSNLGVERLKPNKEIGLIQLPPCKLHKKQSHLSSAKNHLKAIIGRKTDFPSDQSDDDSDKESREKPHPFATRIKSLPTPVLIDSAPTFSGNFLASQTAYCQHQLKLVLFARSEGCAFCGKNISGFFHQGYKCGSCKLCFHKDCNSYSSKFPCIPTSPTASTPPLFDKSSRGSKVITETAKSKRLWSPPTGSRLLHVKGSESTGGWFLNRTSQFTDPTDQIVSSVDELRQISIFVFKKIIDLTKKMEHQRDTVVDAIFKKALREFHTELLSYHPTMKEDQVAIKYKDLIQTFEWTLNRVCVQEQTSSTTFPVILGVNAFRGFLNEFVQTRKKVESKTRTRSFRRKRKKSDVTIHLAHKFKGDIVHVPTYCEMCNQFMWHAEKILICQGCRLSCHKKCLNKVLDRCVASSRADLSCAGHFFGAELTSLMDEDRLVPTVLEKMFSTVELKGLFMEGLYRKSASVAQVKQVRRTLETCPDIDQFTFEDVPVHVITTLIKSFFRELPEPLLTYDLYENLLNVAEVENERERLRCIYSMVELLPKVNRAVLDRLMYHLSRVAHKADVNRMSSQNLAVIFAPCLIKRAQVVRAQEQLNDVNRQTVCIQALIEEKYRQYLQTIEEIVELEGAAEKVSSNLEKIEEHKRHNSIDSMKGIDQAKQLFMEQLEFLDNERFKLIEELPPLAPVASSEDDNITTSSEELDTPVESRKIRSYGLSASVWYSQDEYAVDFSIPPMIPNLRHLTKHRVGRAKQRRPSIAFLSRMKKM